MSLFLYVITGKRANTKEILGKKILLIFLATLTLILKRYHY